MNIKVTNINTELVIEIDRRAKQISNQREMKFSRNDYLKKLIKYDCEKELLASKEKKFEEIIEKAINKLEEQEKILQTYINSNSRYFNLLTSGTYEESEEVYEKTDY